MASLPPLEYQRLLPHLELVELRAGDVLCNAGTPLQHVYFPCNSLVSLMYQGDRNEAMAVSQVGRDGMTSVDMSFGTQISQFKILVQASGSAVRLKPKILVAGFHEREALRKVVLTYTQSLTLQIAQTAACARFHNIEGRLAQLLLMTRDRLTSDHFLMTHEMLSDLLGVRRAGVTNAAYGLKLRGLIEYRRGEIAMVLRQFHCDFSLAAGQSSDSIFPA